MNGYPADKKKTRLFDAYDNERGAVLVIALLVLVLLSTLGAIATNTSMTEIQISANDRVYQQTFLVAESGWQKAAALVDNQNQVPNKDSVTNEVDPVADLGDTVQNVLNNVPFQMNVNEVGNRPVAGSGADYREFVYQVDSTANNRQALQVRVKKVFKTGYN